jgi:hypothetical protein
MEDTFKTVLVAEELGKTTKAFEEKAKREKATKKAET